MDEENTLNYKNALAETIISETQLTVNKEKKGKRTAHRNFGYFHF